MTVWTPPLVIMNSRIQMPSEPGVNRNRNAKPPPGARRMGMAGIAESSSNGIAGTDIASMSTGFSLLLKIDNVRTDGSS